MNDKKSEDMTLEEIFQEIEAEIQKQGYIQIHSGD